MSNHIVLKASHISKHFTDPITVQVLKNISLTIQRGEFVSITGKSGCGKSTLLYILSTMDTDYEGDLYIGGEQMSGRTGKQLAKVRNEKIGFVFQFHYLLPDFSALENVMLPALIQGISPAQAREQAAGLVSKFGGTLGPVYSINSVDSSLAQGYGAETLDRIQVTGSRIELAQYLRPNIEFVEEVSAVFEINR